MAVSEEAGMWNLLTRRNQECYQLQDLLEDAAGEHPGSTSVEDLLGALSPVQRAHFVECRSCHDVAENLAAVREIFKGVASHGQEAGPWFARRVMAAISAREQELVLPASVWSAVPRFASRLSWITAIVLLAGSTWLLERPATSPSKQPGAAAAQEFLFEAPAPPMSQDDVLISMAEKDR
jgi:hypothetical protein